MALRGIEDTLTIRLDSRKGLNAPLPVGFLQHEPNSVRVVRIWESFVSAVNRQCKSLNDFFKNKYRKVAFVSGMQRLCADFSRRTESIKVSFELLRSGKGTTYLLILRKLAAIPDSCRNIQFCGAEIPSQEVQVYADFVSLNHDNIGRRYDPAVHVSVIESDVNSSDIPGTTAVAIVEDSHSLVSSTRSSGTAGSHQNLPQHQDYVLHQHDCNPPVATAVLEIATEPPLPVESDQRSALERMQELESIKSFLSEPEFAAKRLAILNSI